MFVVDVIQSSNSQGVNYTLVGGYAVALHGAMFNKAKFLMLVILFQTVASVALVDTKPVYVMDFGQGPDGDATAWLKSKIFELMLNAKKLNKSFRNGHYRLTQQIQKVVPMPLIEKLCFIPNRLPIERKRYDS